MTAIAAAAVLAAEAVPQAAGRAVARVAAGQADAPAGPDEAYLPAPAYPDVLALARQGKPADALVRLDERLHQAGVTSPPMAARVLRARLLATAGRAAESAAQWQAIAADSAPLRVFGLTSAFQVLLQAGQLPAAARPLDALAQDRDAHPDPQLFVDLADAYLKDGDAAHAAPLYQRVLDAPGKSAAADAAYLGLAAVHERTGDLTGALDVLRQAEQQFLQAATFVAARAAERRIAARLTQPVAPFSEDGYRAIVDRLSTQTSYHEALRMLDEWAAAYPRSDRAAEITSLRVTVLYEMRADARATTAADRFLRDYPSSPFAAGVRVILFRIAVREGRTASVRARGLALWLGRVRGVSPGDRFSLGRLLAAYLVGVGDVREGLSIYRRLYRQAISRADRADILWRTGVAAVRVGEYSRAVTDLASALRFKPGDETEQVCRYWLGAAQARLGRRRAAVDTLVGLVRADPYHYYGAEALSLLAGLTRGHPAWAAEVAQARQPAQAFPALTLDAAAGRDPDFVAAGVLARAGLAAEAADCARQAALRVRDDPALALLAARALDAVGRHRAAVSLLDRRFKPYLDRPATGVPADFWALVYPRAFWTDVKAAAAANHVDPLLLLAVMRQESMFDPSAVSPAGAIGLFQVMSYTASDAGPIDGHPRVGRADLTQPRVSAEIGARLIRRLMNQFGRRNLAAVIASYNAGEDLVSRWLKAVGGRSQPLFVDSMPYSQTRNYVRTVLTNYFAYRRLYGTEAGN